MKRTLLLVLALSFPLALANSEPESPASTPKIVDGPAKEALELFNQGQHLAAIKAARPLAEKGDADALFLIGFAAETGQGCDPSRKIALESYQKAAANGHQEANNRRALILLNSKDEEDRQQARTALEKAAKENPRGAGRILGEAYLRSFFSEQPDFSNTVLWWSTASEAGDTASTLLLARLYSGDFGFAEKIDRAKAITLLRKAAELGEQAAYLPLGSQLLNGSKEIRNEKEGRKWLQKATEAKLITAYLALGDFEESIRKDDKAAYAAYLKGAEAQQSDCMLRLARLIYQGRGVEKDEEKSREWIDKAAQAGNPSAAFEMARLLSNTDKPEFAKIYPYLLAAANGNIPLAQNELGLLYLSGKLGAADYPAAVAWFTRAAKAGLAKAQHNLATLYQRGMGVPLDYSSAGELYSLAANQGHPAATTALAQMTAQGLGTKADLAKAWALATLALERGDASAKTLLGELSPQLTSELLIAAEKELSRLKNPEPEKTPDPKKTP